MPCAQTSAWEIWGSLPFLLFVGPGCSYSDMEQDITFGKIKQSRTDRLQNERISLNFFEGFFCESFRVFYRYLNYVKNTMRVKIYPQIHTGLPVPQHPRSIKRKAVLLWHWKLFGVHLPSLGVNFIFGCASWAVVVLTWRDRICTEIQKTVFILNVVHKAHEKTDIHQKLRLGHAEHLLCCRGEWSLILDCLLNYLRT